MLNWGGECDLLSIQNPFMPVVKAQSKKINQLQVEYYLEPSGWHPVSKPGR